MGNNCEDKIKLSCPPNSPSANCVKTGVQPPTFSSLINTCNSVQEVETDMYTLIGGIKTEIDLSAITTICGILPIPKNVKTLIQYLVNRDCTQQALIEALTIRVTTLETKVTAIQANPCP